MENYKEIIDIYEIENLRPTICSSILYTSLPQDIINIILSYTESLNEYEMKKIITNNNIEKSIINEINHSIYKRMEKEKRIDDESKDIKAFYLSSFIKEKEIIYDNYYHYNNSNYDSDDILWDDDNISSESDDNADESDDNSKDWDYNNDESDLCD
jgi:hypothetical protein